MRGGGERDKLYGEEEDFKDVIISIFSTFARMERIKISSRTKAGLARAKANGVQLGRRSTITDGQIQRVWESTSTRELFQERQRWLHFRKEQCTLSSKMMFIPERNIYN